MTSQRRFGRYLIVGELGRGAMGAVHLAQDPLIEREVAIKTLLPDLPMEVMGDVRERLVAIRPLCVGARSRGQHRS